jgi:signal transduction histidine kinase
MHQESDSRWGLGAILAQPAWSTARCATAAAALARRSRIGALAYVCLATVIALSAASRLSSVSRASFVAGTVILCGFRWWVAAAQAPMNLDRPATWWKLFRLGTLASGLYWGVCAGFGLGRTLDADSLVVLLTTAGIVAGAVPTLAPDLTLVRLFTLCILCPPWIGVLMSGGSQSWGTAAVILFFLVYMQIQGRQQHRDYHEALDQTEQLQLKAAAIEEQRQRAELAQVAAAAASRAKSVFLTNMSHELRTPLTAIIGYAELLLTADLASERIDHAQVIERNGRHLLQILNDILDLSQIEGAGLALQRERFSLAALLREIESVMRVPATERGIRLVVRLDTPVPSQVTGDATRVRQILLNLVGNAIKFTEHGSVHILASCTTDAEPRIAIAVQDTGVGLSEEAQQKLFAPFAQADESATRQFGGTGLGLHISRHLARMMQGEVHMRSQLAKGSTFTLELPLQRSDLGALVESLGEPPSAEATREAEPRLRAGPALEGVRVLLAEDGVDDQNLVRSILTRAGATVDVVDNGIDAVKRALSATIVRGYDVVLLDMEMPELDGYGATARLRAVGYELPIVALTADTSPMHRERSRAAGCDEHLNKPIDRATLIATVRSRADSAPGRKT